MTSPLSRIVFTAVAASLVSGAFAYAVAARSKAEPRQAHMVFFALKDHSPEARAKFVESCHKYLSGHEGTVYYSVGVIADDVVEPGVSVRDFDVALHLVFENKAAGAAYLKAPRHLQFVEENKPHFGKVRVFDSYLTQQP